MEYKQIEVVVSWYNEDLSWIANLIQPDYKITIYSKLHNNHEKYSVFKLENIGRCDHTYLYHIYYNWDDLADITLFLPETIGISELKTRKLQYILQNINQIEGKGIVTQAHTQPGLRVEYRPRFKLKNYDGSFEIHHINKRNLNLCKIRPFGE